jgi:MFS family permease
LTSSGAKWISVTAVGTVCFVVAGSGAAIVGPVFGPMRAELGWSDALTSSLASAYTLAYLLSTPVIGLAIDRYGARQVMAVGIVWAAAGLLWASGAHSWRNMVAAFALAGVGINASFYLPSATLITQWIDRNTALAMGIVMGTMSAGSTLFSMLIGGYVEHYGWRSTMQGFAALIALMLIVIGAGIRARPARGSKRPTTVPAPATAKIRSAGHDLLSPAFLITLASWVLFSFGMQGIYFHVVPLLAAAGYSASLAGTAYGGTWLLSAVGSLALGVIADRFGARRTLAGALLCCCLGTLVLLGASQSTLGIVSVAAFVLLWGGSVNCFGQLAPVLFAQRGAASHLGALISVPFAAAGVSGAVAPVITGLIHDRSGSYHWAIGLSAVAILLAFLLVRVER